MYLVRCPAHQQSGKQQAAAQQPAVPFCVHVVASLQLKPMCLCFSPGKRLSGWSCTGCGTASVSLHVVSLQRGRHCCLPTALGCHAGHVACPRSDRAGAGGDAVSAGESSTVDECSEIAARGAAVQRVLLMSQLSSPHDAAAMSSTWSLADLLPSWLLLLPSSLTLSPCFPLCCSTTTPRGPSTCTSTPPAWW